MATTPEEAIEVLIKAGLTPEQAAEFREFVVLLTNQEQVLAQIAAGVLSPVEVETVLQTLRDGITVPVDDVTLRTAANAADDIARQQAETLASNMTKSELEKIAQTVTQGLQDGLDVDAVARNLESVTGLDSRRASQYQKYVNYLETTNLTDAQVQNLAESKYNKLLRDRRKSIANYEMNQAMSQARRIEADALGAIGKYQITTGDARVSIHCLTNAAVGVIPINKAFPDGTQHTPVHPGCRCAIGYVQNNEQAKRRHKEQMIETKATAELSGVDLEFSSLPKFEKIAA